MARKKKNLVGKVISVRVTDDDMAVLRKVMKQTNKSASTIMREVISSMIAPFF